MVARVVHEAKRDRLTSNGRPKPLLKSGAVNGVAPSHSWFCFRTGPENQAARDLRTEEAP